MKALVTGGAGFIGSTLVDRLLAEGHEVDVVDDLSTGSLANLSQARAAKAAFSFHQLEVEAAEMVELMVRRRPEVIFHLAAQPSVASSVERPFQDAVANVLGSLRVLEGARACGARKLVFAASGGTLYGDVADEDLPVTENHAPGPRSPYGVGKKVVIDYLSVYRELYGIEFSALAMSNVYGPRQDPRGEAGVVAVFVSNLVRNRACTIYGDGDQTRDFLFVDDAVDAFARASERGSGLVMNIGTGVETSINDLYRMIAEPLGIAESPGRGPAREGEVRRSALDASRAALHLGWRPWTCLRDGLNALLDSYTDNAREADTRAPR